VEQTGRQSIHCSPLACSAHEPVLRFCAQ